MAQASFLRSLSRRISVHEALKEGGVGASAPWAGSPNRASTSSGSERMTQRQSGWGAISVPPEHLRATDWPSQRPGLNMPKASQRILGIGITE